MVSHHKGPASSPAAGPAMGGAGGRVGCTVSAEDAGLRLDAFVARRILGASVAATRKWMEQNPVTVDGRPLAKGHHLAAGQRVEASAPRHAAVAPNPALGLDVLYEEAGFVAVNKPAGLPSHPLGAGESDTVASAILARYPECAGASEDPLEGGLAHRLDVGTSGVLLAARTRQDWRALREVLARGACEKTYLAEVVGTLATPPEQGPLVIDAPIGRRGRRSAGVTVGQGRGLLPARTEIRARARRGETTLVEAHLSHGRAHQVRAHLAHVGHPVLGDAIYATPEAAALAERLGIDGFRLHALEIRFAHPFSGRALVIAAPAPAWAQTD